MNERIDQRVHLGGLDAGPDPQPSDASRLELGSQLIDAGAAQLGHSHQLEAAALEL